MTVCMVGASSAAVRCGDICIIFAYVAKFYENVEQCTLSWWHADDVIVLSHSIHFII